MSIDVHPGLPPVALRDAQIIIDDEYDRGESWVETVITVLAATITVVFVSFVAVLMALA